MAQVTPRTGERAGPRRASPVGQLLRPWRERRGLSQLALSVEAEVSARHLSFVETGRAHPSRGMLLLLARALDVPPRGRNELLVAAGYAPVYRQTDLDAPEMAQVRRALELMLHHQEPFPALVVDGRWNVVTTNEGARRLLGIFIDASELAAVGPPNAIRLFCHPRGMRRFVRNWAATAASLVQWLHRDVLRGTDPDARTLLEEVLGYPDVPATWRMLDVDAPTAPVLAVELDNGEVRASFFSTLTTLGTAYDITVDELRVESFFPADAATEALMQTLAARA